jgi:hypothetical protein
MSPCTPARRRAALLSLVAACAVALVGCGGTGKAEDTTDFRARVGDCFAAAADPPVPCSRSHEAQTVYVSDQRVIDTARAVRPCHAAQARFLGADVNTRLDVRLWIANDKSWYRCDVLLRKSTRGDAGYERITGSLRHTLAQGVPAHLQACLAERYRPAVDQRYESCSEKHVAQELTLAAAIGVRNEPFPADVAERARNACNASASASGLLAKGRSVRAFYPKTAKAWASGQRAALCWVSADDPAKPLPRVAD